MMRQDQELYNEPAQSPPDEDPSVESPDPRDEIIRRLNEALSRPLDELLVVEKEERAA